MPSGGLGHQRGVEQVAALAQQRMDAQFFEYGIDGAPVTTLQRPVDRVEHGLLLA